MLFMFIHNKHLVNLEGELNTNHLITRPQFEKTMKANAANEGNDSCVVVAFSFRQ